MYKKDRNRQFTLEDFNHPIGLKMNPENHWIKKAALIPWDEMEDRYAKLFPSHKGMPAKPLRVALGSLLIQKQYNYSDRELVEQIKENPYYQYFIGLPGYQYGQAYAPSLAEIDLLELTLNANTLVSKIQRADFKPNGYGVKQAS